MIRVPAGPYRLGSTQAEREQAYEDFKATSGRDSARRNHWFDKELEARQATLDAYAIDRWPVTQGAYREYLRSEGLEGPHITEAQWRAQGFIQDYQREVQRFNWTGQEYPKGREDHPVVLVTAAEAAAYCHWRGRLVGETRVLPSAEQFEKAARGPSGAAYPWGESYDPELLNSADHGPRDTVPVGSYPRGASAAHVEGMAGNVFQWTSTGWPLAAGGSPKAKTGANAGRVTVKGSAWDDHGGVGRAASAHGRPAGVRHAIVGFRCASDLRQR